MPEYWWGGAATSAATTVIATSITTGGATRTVASNLDYVSTVERWDLQRLGVGSYAITLGQAQASAAYRTSMICEMHSAGIINWATTATLLDGGIAGAPFVPRKKTLREVRAELKRRADYEREAAERREREAAANVRAEALLRASLTREQRENLDLFGCFYLNTKAGRRYRIDRGTHGNVKLVDARGCELERLCAQPNGVPTCDAMLAQKLALEANEESYRRVANITPCR